jgi:tetratricopeptide (TPR) repeat protein
VAEQFENSQKYAETIRPIKRQSPASSATVTAAARANAPAKRPWFASPALGAAALALLLFGVFFVLPRITERAEPQSTVVNEAAEVAAPVPTLSPEAFAELDRKAQRDLAALVTQQDRLESRNVAQWGGEEWLEYQVRSRAGDDAYLARDVEAAATAYAEALVLGERLLTQSNTIVVEAMGRGLAALGEGDADSAATEFDLILGIFPSHVGALDGKARALRLPEVLELVREGRAEESTGELPAAIDLYRRALEIDAEWQPAQDALAEANGRLAQYRFEKTLSDGYVALAESRFADAVEAFSAGLAMHPNSQEALDGLFQANEGARLGQISLARVRATAFERRELWSEAIAQYEAALAVDPTLEFALEGFARARERRDLELKILNLVDNPRLLFDDTVLVDAASILDEARTVAPQGVRIEEQAARLDRLITLASTPLTVELRSDALTQVTVYRVGTIGTFTTTTIDLRPGNYTVIGSRNGYRDVRRTFTVIPGQAIEEIEVICVEPI